MIVLNILKEIDLVFENRVDRSEKREEVDVRILFSRDIFFNFKMVHGAF
jgi:hypothetical protein